VVDGKSAVEELGLNTLRNPSCSFWNGKRVLLTGHTGFKGSWLAWWLQRLGAEVTGIALPSLATPDLFTLLEIESLCESRFCDIRDSERLAEIIREADPEVVFHLAAQPLVRESYRDPLATFSTNIQGTVHVLEALRPLDSIHTVVAVTTDKVYKNLERVRAYVEGDELGGHDPYSASKAASELVIASYRDSFFAEKGVALASARAGNVIGGGDWSLDRLLPDAVRAWSSNQPLTVRRPGAVRPWQHVLEPVAGYLLLAEAMGEEPALAGPYNFGPMSEGVATVRDVVGMAQEFYGKGEVIWLEDESGPVETDFLSLDASAAKATLGVAPRWSLEEAVRRTIKWYRRQADGADARGLCRADLTGFELAVAGGSK
jgi:CDP-glucose 4,6-dehydratase